MLVNKILKISVVFGFSAFLSVCAKMDDAAKHVQVVNDNNAFTSQCNK